MYINQFSSYLHNNLISVQCDFCLHKSIYGVQHHHDSFLFCVNHFCSDYICRRCGPTCCFFARDIRSLRASISTHSGFYGFVSIFIQENHNFHRSFISSFVIFLALIGSKKPDHGVVVFFQAWQRCLFLWISLCLVSSCMFVERCNLASYTLQLGKYSCAPYSLQLYILTSNYIFLFVMLLIVNVATFVVVLWLFRFDICLDCPLFHHLYHPLLERDILNLLAHILPLNL